MDSLAFVIADSVDRMKLASIISILRETPFEHGRDSFGSYSIHVVPSHHSACMCPRLCVCARGFVHRMCPLYALADPDALNTNTGIEFQTKLILSFWITNNIVLPELSAQSQVAGRTLSYLIEWKLHSRQHQVQQHLASTVLQSATVFTSS